MTPSNLRAALERHSLPKAAPRPHTVAQEPLEGLTRSQGAPIVCFSAIGAPAPQGSKKHVGKGVMVESSKRVKPWRESVAYAALEQRNFGGKLYGPVAVRLVFTVPKPQSAHRGPKSKKPRDWPMGCGDIDKLARAVLDSLGSKKGAGLIEDDRKVIELTCLKVWPGEHADALDCPGVRIEVRRVS